MTFHSQFLLGFETYRDNNNFIRHNSLEFTIDRWSLAPESFTNQFLDFEPYPNWMGEKLPWPLNTTRDGGITWEVEDYQMIFGAYFFLSEDKVERFKILSNITEVIAIIEGVAALLIMFVKIIPSYINAKQMEAKSIRNTYFDVDHSKFMDKNQESIPTKPMKFNIWDKSATLKRSLLRKVCRCYTPREQKKMFSKNQQTYLRAHDQF